MAIPGCAIAGEAKAETALVKAASPTESMCRLALLASASFAALGARVWYEHVPSKDNPADAALSRDGHVEEVVLEALRASECVQITPCEPPHNLGYDDLWRAHADV